MQYRFMQSVHLLNFPKPSFKIDTDIVFNMDLIRNICNCVFAMRKEANIRVRMPLSKITICGNYNISDDYLNIIKQEVNVKQIDLYQGNFDEIATKEIVFDMKECGKIFGSKFKEILIAQKKCEWKILENGNLQIAGIEVEKALFKVNYKPLDGSFAQQCSDYNILIILDTNMTEELILEGLSRDVVRIIQQIRKDIGLEISNMIDITINSSDDVFEKIVNVYGDFIKEQTLALHINLSKNKNVNNLKDYEIEGHSFSVEIQKLY